MGESGGGPTWRETGIVSVVLGGTVFILVASVFGRPVDGTTLTAFVGLSTYLIGQAVTKRRNGKGPSDE